MIDLTVTASDDVELLANVEWNFQWLFASMHEQAANAARAAANGSRHCKSVICADQWEADTHVLFGVGRELMLIYVRDHSDMVETRQIKVIVVL